MPNLHPQHVGGRFRNLKNGISVVLQALLFLTPWWLWKGQPVALVDLQGRKLHLFGTTFWPQETHLLLLLVLAAGLSLFLVSATLGRLWCGFACPQTLLSHAFIMVERLIEGDAYKRRRLDARPWKERFPKRLARLTVWLAMSVYLGITFAGYFAPIRQVIADLACGRPSPLILFFTVVAMVFFGYLRGGFCTSLCPYARFQSVMTSPQTRMVAYDLQRGEPRGKVSDPGAADCTDCKACVRVCPMGIDIRDGFQFACINCASCIDACDHTMEGVGRPKGLVSFVSMEELQARQPKPLGRWLRELGPRPALYAAALLATLSLLGYLTSTRAPYSLQVVRESAGTAVTTSFDGRSTNRYTLRVINRGSEPREVSFRLEGAPAGAELVMTENPARLPGESVSSLSALVLCPGQRGALVVPLTFCLTSAAGEARRDTTFVFGGQL